MANAKQATKQVELTPQQEQAAALAAEGKTVEKVAEQIGADAATVATWRASPYFVAEVSRRQQAAWASAQDRLRSLVPQALGTLEQAVQGGDLRAVVEVLKAAGVYGKASAPSGEVDPELVMVRQAEAWARVEYEKQGPQDIYRLLRRDEETAELARGRLQTLRGGAL